MDIHKHWLPVEVRYHVPRFAGHLPEVDGIEQNIKQITRECMPDGGYTLFKARKLDMLI